MTTIEHRDEEPSPAANHAGAGSESHAGAGHDHPANLAHHFESMPQQFEAAKLGMWLFLATEVLLFGGLFCLYAVFRGNNPEVFTYGSRYLDTAMGATNTVVLIVSSLTMAIAVTAAQLNRQRLLIACLSLTIVGGLTFLVIKYFEYEHKIHQGLVWGLAFYQDPHGAPHGATMPGAGEDVDALAIEAAPDPARGKAMWMETCRACHGLAGEGIPGQGKDIRGSEFIAEQTDDELLAFVKVGRMPFDALNTTGIQMPPKGGNPLLKDPDLRDIIAYLRTFKASEPGDEAAPGTGDDALPDVASTFWVPRSAIPDAAAGPAGLEARGPEEMEQAGLHGAADLPPHARDPSRPHNAHLFFGIYFLMTGLHGIHVLVGILAMSWLLVRVLCRHFSSEYYTPVDLVGLYWHVVDLIWIFLFPLFYLIH
ncbi:MAG: cytochrome c oxidase subunit 3 [Planctomycetota bacterium]|jgi:cytochrome c oxidase subunit 3